MRRVSSVEKIGVRDVLDQGRYEVYDRGGEP